MDNFTLIICTSLISLFLTCTTLVLYQVCRNESYLLDWTIAGSCFLLSNLTRALNIQFDLPLALVASLANGCYIAGNIAVLSGVLRLTTGLNARAAILGGGLLIAGLHQLSLFQSSIEYRMLLLFPLSAGLNALSVYLLWRARTQFAGRAYWPLLIATGFYSLEISIRGGLMIWNPADYPMQGNQLMQTLGTLCLMLYLFMLTVSFVVIVNWKRELILKEILITDKLTGWLNRNDFDKLATDGFCRAKSEQQLFGFIYFDIDHFKSINDRHGHSIGDKAIQHVCNLAARHTRNLDHKFRMGGEEFVICVTEGSLKSLSRIAQRIRSEVESHPLHIAEETIALTISVGISVSNEHDLGWEPVLERADKALYQSKASGRNCVSEWLPA